MMLSSPKVPASPSRGGFNGGQPSRQRRPPQPQTTTPVTSERERAVQEAKDCLQAVRYEGFQLDGFNLLGVVANPRTGMIGSSTPATPSSRHSITAAATATTTPSRPSTSEASSTTATPNAANPMTPTSGGPPEDPAEPDMFTDAVHSLEYTMAQVTEQIETFNMFLGELSRQYLGDDGGESLFLEYYYQDEDEHQPIPPPHQLLLLANGGDGAGNIDSNGGTNNSNTTSGLAELQAYLEQCGVLAHSLFAQGLETTSHDYNHTMEELQQELETIPPVFAQTNFDLTHSETFVQLLLQQDDDEDDEENENEGSNGEEAPEPSSTAPTPSLTTPANNSLYQSTYELVPVKEPDALAGYLDRVEVALQEQVRQKSGAFFQETTRFRQLQSSIEELLQQVQTIRTSIHHILLVYRQTKDVSNHQRHEYEQLVDLMDAAMELIRCKASIGGLLSANDHWGAAQQIQYGRRLLQGGQSSVNNNGDTAPPIASSSALFSLELHQLTALSTCGDQFQQYESLVVQNLSEELVDVFFHWRSSEKERVQEMVQALRLCGALPKTGELYTRRLQQTIRMTVRTTIAEFVESFSNSTPGSGGSGVTGMTYPAFYNCLGLLMEELMTVLKMSRRVDTFCQEEDIFGDNNDDDKAAKRWTQDAMISGADLATKSIAELLRLRKEAHSLITLNEMKQLWDTCLQFTLNMEDYGKTKAIGLRSTLVGQAKAFIDRTHESNMSSLVAALDSERWTQCEVSAERQAALTRLCTGRTLMATSTIRRKTNDKNDDDGPNNSTTSNSSNNEKKPIAEVEGVKYKVVWSCLLLVEMTMTNLSAAAHFQSLAANAVAKVAELMRVFNTRATQLVLGAGAIHSTARLKSINAKHLSMVTQCVGMMVSLLPHIRAALMAQLPAKQHTLLNDLDRIKKDYLDHNEKVLNKFVSIIGGIVEHGLAPRIANTDFDARARDLPIDTPDKMGCCVFLDGTLTTTRKMHQVLNLLLPPDHLQDVFSRIFAFLDQILPTLFIKASSTATKTPNGSPLFQFPITDEGKRCLILEVEKTTQKLNGLKGVLAWEFTCMTVLERKLDYKMAQSAAPQESSKVEANGESSKGEEPAEDEAQTPTVDATPEPSESQNGQMPNEDAPSGSNDQTATGDAPSDTNDQTSAGAAPSDMNGHTPAGDSPSDMNDQKSAGATLSDTNGQACATDAPSDAEKTPMKNGGSATIGEEEAQPSER